jgi:hypothetical protein
VFEEAEESFVRQAAQLQVSTVRFYNKVLYESLDRESDWRSLGEWRRR